MLSAKNPNLNLVIVLNFRKKEGSSHNVMVTTLNKHKEKLDKALYSKMVEFH